MRFLTDDNGMHTDRTSVNVETGTSGDDTLTGTAGDDKILGGAGNDTISDTLGGNDYLIGGAGDDIITVDRSSATSTDHIKIDAGDGNDTVTYTGDVGNKVTLNIDAGGGANTVNVENAYQVHVFGGAGVDTVTISTDMHAEVHAAGGDNIINASSDNAAARTGISAGDGDDTVNLESENDGHYRMRLGGGVNTVNQAASTDGSAVKEVFYGFQAGDGGDQVNLDAYLKSVLTHHAGGDLFASDHLRLIDGTTPGGQAAAYLEMDMDGDKNGANWVKLAVFVGVAADALTAYNLGGIDPTVTTPDEGHHNSDHFVI